MQISRLLTSEMTGPYAGLAFVAVTSHVADQRGATAFKHDDIIVPSTWGQVAADILAKKYFRKSGVARALRKIEEPGVPSWLWRSVPDIAAMGLLAEADWYGGENDARQVFGRIAGAITYWGWKGGYFHSEADAEAFHDEIRHMLARQMAAPNSPQWFNTGLHWAYGIEGTAGGHFVVDAVTNEVKSTLNAFERPQTHSCFIQTVGDSLVDAGGILPLFVDEARIAKFGSGTGTNFSDVRGASEGLSGGGTACGLIAVLQAGDRAASLVTASGSTRRASKMVIVDIDHPDIEAFVQWKAGEERKVASLITGSRVCSEHMTKIMTACVESGASYEPSRNPALKRAMRAARRAHLPENYIRRAVQFARQGFEAIEFPVYDGDWNSAAYGTVSGQNANNTVRVSDAFLNEVEAGGPWSLLSRRERVRIKSIDAAGLWDDIGHAVWASAEPGIHYATTINDWHTCPAAGEIRASNSCSEFLFLDNTGATLASLNLMRFKTERGPMDLPAYEHACRLWTVALEISVSMAQFPSSAIARRTHDYRPLGLGYANLGGLLMASGIPYDSDQGRALCAGLTAIMSGVAYATSAEMACELGPFAGYAANREAMLRVIRNHGRAATGKSSGYDGVSIAPVALDTMSLSAMTRLDGSSLIARAAAVWHAAVELGSIFGFRNAQVSCIAPTGTIGLVMDCDTTGIEPDFSLVKFKTLAGGGYFKIINNGVPAALRELGYGDAAIVDIEHYAIGHGSLRDAPAIDHAALARRGFTPDKIALVERELPAAFDIQFVFNAGTLGRDFLTDVLKVPADRLVEGCDLLRHLGFNAAEIEAANVHVCGAMTLEGAPHLDPAHLIVFDCANPCGRTGTRFLSVESHIRMMAAAQPFLSGAISKTVNMPNDATVEDCKRAYVLSWKLGLKANALYRDGSKLSQPLSAHRLVEDEEEMADATALPAVEPTMTDQIRLVAEGMADDVIRGISQGRDRPTPGANGTTDTAVVDGQRVTLQARRPMVERPADAPIAAPESGQRTQLANDIAVAISLGLQHGVPLERYVTALASKTFAKDDLSGERDAAAIVERIFERFGVDYLGRYDLQAERPAGRELGA